MLCEDLPSRSSLLLKKQTLEEKIALAFSNTSSLCDLFHARVKHCLSHMVVFSLCYMVLLGLEMVWAAKKNSYSFDELGLMTVIAISLLAALQSCQILSRLDVGLGAEARHRLCNLQHAFQRMKPNPDEKSNILNHVYKHQQLSYDIAKDAKHLFLAHGMHFQRLLLCYCLQFASWTFNFEFFNLGVLVFLIVKMHQSSILSIDTSFITWLAPYQFQVTYLKKNYAEYESWAHDMQALEECLYSVTAQNE